MKKYINSAAILIFAVAILLGCSSGGNSGGSSDQTTTVLVYMMGTDLQSNNKQGLGNIIEMESVGSTSTMNVILQTGAANESNGDQNIDWTRNQRWKVLNGSLEQLADLGPDGGEGGNMGTESTFESFVRWGVQTYPADKYIVVLWDHGAGINGGIGRDDITNDAIPQSQIAYALNRVATSENVTFEITGYDACLMATSEVAASLVQSSNYMVASEDVEPGAGWNYTVFLDYLANNPNANGAQIGQAIVDGYASKMESANSVYTLSVTQLNKIPALISATNLLAQKLLPYATESIDSWESIAYTRLSALDYQTSMFLGTDNYDLVDMKQFVGNIGKEFKHNADIIATSDAVAEALNQAVIYESSNYSNLGSTGLTVYFPSLMDTYPDKNYSSNTLGYLTGTPFFASKYTESDTGLVAVYYNYYYKESGNLAALFVDNSFNSTTESITAVVQNKFSTVLAAANGTTDCSAFTVNKAYESVVSTSVGLCYSAFSDKVSVSESDLARQYNISFESPNVWAKLGGTNIALIPTDPNFKATTPESYSEYMIPVAYQGIDKGKIFFSAGYLRVEEDNSTHLLKVTGFQPSGNPVPKSSPLEANQKYYLGAYISAKAPDSADIIWQWAYLSNSVYTVPASYNSQTKPVYLTIGKATTGNKFTFVVAGITGSVYAGESVTYSIP